MNRRRFVNSSIIGGLTVLSSGCLTIRRPIDERVRILDDHRMIREEEGTRAENVKVISSAKNISEATIDFGLMCKFIDSSEETLASPGELALNVQPSETEQFEFRPVKNGIQIVGEKAREIDSYQLEILHEDDFRDMSDDY